MALYSGSGFSNSKCKKCGASPCQCNKRKPTSSSTSNSKYDSNSYHSSNSNYTSNDSFSGGDSSGGGCSSDW